MEGSSELQVKLGHRSYKISVGTDLIANAGAILKKHIPAAEAVIVTDTNVAEYWLHPLTASIENQHIKVDQIILSPGEETKDFREINRLAEKLLDLPISRKTVLIALGGGVVGDITGFAAAISLRGIDYIQIPTTLLSQVDSSIGGKTGINTRHGKNLIGAFHQPRAVIADMLTLDTLPKRELLAGYAEILKYGIIRDAHFFDWLSSNSESIINGDKDAQSYAVIRSCALKAEIIETDEFETQERMLLNLGHTFGHAFEVETGYSDRLLHGEAVSIGLVVSADLSVRLGLCPESDLEKIRTHLNHVGLPTSLKKISKPDWSAARLIKHMSQDKKAESGNLTFILPEGIGKASINRNVTQKELEKLLNYHLEN